MRRRDGSTTVDEKEKEGRGREGKKGSYMGRKEGSFWKEETHEGKERIKGRQ